MIVCLEMLNYICGKFMQVLAVRARYICELSFSHLYYGLFLRALCTHALSLNACGFSMLWAHLVLPVF